MRYIFITALLATTMLASPVLAQQGAFNSLSPGNQKIAQALFNAEVENPPSPGTTPLTLDQIAAMKENGNSWGKIFRDMKAQGLVQERNLGEAVSAGARLQRGNSARRNEITKRDRDSLKESRAREKHRFDGDKGKGKHRDDFDHRTGDRDGDRDHGRRSHFRADRDDRVVTHVTRPTFQHNPGRSSFASGRGHWNVANSSGFSHSAGTVGLSHGSNVAVTGNAASHGNSFRK